MKFYTRTDFNRWNQQQECSAPGCTRKRFHGSKYCLTHYEKMTFTGTLDARTTLARKEVMHEVAKVRRVLDRNIGQHEGLDIVIRYINAKLKAAAAGEAIQNARLWRALSLYEATPIDIIARAGAVYALWVDRSPLLKSEVHLLYNVGKAITGLINQARCGLSRSKGMFKRLGAELDDQFRLFFISLGKAAHEMVKREKERERMLSQGFK